MILILAILLPYLTRTLKIATGVGNGTVSRQSTCAFRRHDAFGMPKQLGMQEGPQPGKAKGKKGVWVVNKGVPDRQPACDRNPTSFFLTLPRLSPAVPLLSGRR